MEGNVQIKRECVCGSTHFMQEDGRTYCLECQIELQSVREIVYDKDEYAPEADQTQRSRVLTTTVKKTNAQSNELPTSWECYNQLLCNLVDEVEDIEENLTSHIKRDFKLTVLQIWAAYLRYHKKAFFSKESADYPQFEANYKIIDAEIIYKIRRPPRKRSVPKKLKASTHTRVRKSERRILQKKANQLELSKNKKTIPSEDSESNFNIRLQYTTRAKEYLKSKMSDKHFTEHERNPTLLCHKRENYRPCNDVTIGLLDAILYMALNHVESDIQLGDLIRFFKEGHVTFRDTSSVSNNARYNTQFKNRILKGSYIPIHNHYRHIAHTLAKEIGYQFKKPDLGALCKRYLKELCLPSEIGSLIDVIFHVCPPSITDVAIRIPNYEGRAMAFILFILKLLFGLDDSREYKISASSRKLNMKMNYLNKNILNDDVTEQKMLFVWCDWVEYIEMRNNVLKRFHFPSALASGDEVTQMYLQFLRKNDEKHADGRSTFKSSGAPCEQVKNEFQTTYNLNPKYDDSLNFYASLTPKRSYMDELRFSGRSDVIIPTLLDEPHDELDIEPFLRPSKLKAFFQQHDTKLVIKKLGYNENIKFKRLSIKNEYVLRYLNFDFDITTGEWLDYVKIQNGMKSPKDVITKPEVDLRLFKIKEHNRQIRKEKKGSQNQLQTPYLSTETEPTNDENLLNQNVELTDIFDCVCTDDEDVVDQGNNIPTQPLDETLSLVMSNFDYWMLFGTITNTKNDFSYTRDMLPKTFQWLLKTGADLIENKEMDLYLELVIVENYFAKNVKPLKFSPISKYKRY